ncbi:acyltransferase family protein [Micrococcus luteus]|uniref:acyltransferase family protein n=1 Tax=Micrococcus luteus TaxID=1270 RepID=UPI00301ACC66
MPRPVNKSAAYYPGLDGLRTIAVGLVVAYHIGVPGTGGGLLGVGVFFTLSGFLITMLLLNRWEKHGDLDLKHFWIRRFRRLLPAVVLLLIVVMIATVFVHPDKLGDRGEQAFFALIYVANWHTIFTGGSYFEQFDGPSPLDHLWSLAVEEQFYVVWPLLLLGMLTLFKAKKDGEGTAAAFKKAAVVTFVLGAISFVLLAMLADPTGDSTRAYEGTDTRAGGLLWGAVLAMLWRPKKVAKIQSEKALWTLDILGVLGVAGILWLAATTDQLDYSLYTWGIAALTVSTILVLMPLIHAQSWTNRVLGIAPLRWIGERSYGIYLWHMPVVAFLPERTLYGQDVWRGLIVVALTVLFAELSWRFVEDPIRRHGFIPLVTGRVQREAREARERQARLEEGTVRARRAQVEQTPVPAVPSRGLLAGGAVGVTVLAIAAMAGLAVLPQKSVVEIAREEQARQADVAAPGGQGKGEGGAAAPTPSKPVARPAATETSCETVVHIGDSTSTGASNNTLTRVADPAKRITGQYEAVGVKKVVEEVAGGRSMIETLEPGELNPGEKGTNAPDAMREAAGQLGEHGCWVVNVGLNDAANMAKAGDFSSAEKRIDGVMQAADGKPVLWVNGITMPWTKNEFYANENIQKLNAVLVEVTAKYPNLRVYDWASDAAPHPDWFLEDDANHNNAEGSAAKAEHMAKALVAAFPKGEDPVKEKVVRGE